MLCSYAWWIFISFYSTDMSLNVFDLTASMCLMQVQHRKLLYGRELLLTGVLTWSCKQLSQLKWYSNIGFNKMMKYSIERFVLIIKSTCYLYYRSINAINYIYIIVGSIVKRSKIQIYGNINTLKYISNEYYIRWEETFKISNYIINETYQ